GDRRMAEDVIACARANNITQIIIGKSTRTRWFEIVHGSVVHDLVRHAGNISVHVVAGEELAREPVARKTVVTAAKPEPFDPRPYVFALLAVGISLGIGELLWAWIGVENIDLVFLTAIVAMAVRFGLWPSLLASIASTLCYNFFFTEPYYTFAIADPKNVLAVIFFTLGAILASNVPARPGVQAAAPMARARTPELLYAFSRKLAAVGTLDDV